MSCVIVIPIIIPAASAAWPAIAIAATAAASALGFAVAKSSAEVEVEVEEEVEVLLENSEAVTQGLAHGEELVFEKGNAKIKFARSYDGKLSVHVSGKGLSKTELHEMGEKFGQSITQQYVYNRLVTEMKNRDMNLVGEEIDEDGTVRIQVRTYRG